MPNTKFKPILLISILFFLLIFLSAFANQPVNTSVSNPTPTPTSIYAIPRLQLPQVDPLPITTPDAPADQYTLADWNAETALLALANYRIDTEFPREHPNPYLTLLEESYLQFPELAQDESFLLEIATIRDITAFPEMNPRLSDTLPALPIYTKLLENALNREEIYIEDAEEWIRKNMTGITIESIHSNNLFSDQADVWAYNIIKFDGNLQAILFVSQNINGTYSVRTFSNDDWEYPYRRNFEIKIQDLNGNGIPEIIMERLYWYHYGIEDSYKDINIYEWNGDHFVSYLHEAPSVHFFTAKSEEVLNVWTYDIQSDGSTMIIGKQTSLTTEGCPVYIEYFYYRWTGHSFELDHINVEPLPENTSESCKVIWSLAATQNESQSIPAISAALDDWPDSLNNEFGPAAQDYFRLWLAETYALHGESETALQMLDDLISNPQNPLYIGIPEMAEVYKNSYIEGGPYLACQVLEEWKENELHKAFELSKSSDLDSLDILSEQWGVSVEEFQSGKSCEFYSNFPTILEHQAFSSRNQLVGWLYRNQIQWNGLREIDMNQDGLKDWLVITQTNYGKNELWALIQKEGAILPILVTNTPGGEYTTFNLQTSCNQYFPEDGSSPVQIYRIGSHAVAFQIIDQGNRSYPFIHFEIGDLMTKSTWVRGVEQNNKTITIFFNHSQYQYQWHDQHQRFELLQSTADESESPSLEELLFIEQNPQAVIDELEAWFKSINPTTEDSWESYYIENTLPYRTYLLGLAYELNSQNQKAIQTYYNLWKTYPESPFTTIARYKLEKVK